MSEKDRIAQQLAKSHSTHEPSLTRIIRFITDDEDRDDEPIKLVEVNDATVESGVMPVHFGPSGTIPYPSVVVELTPAEYEAVENHRLPLPQGWKPGDILFEQNNGQ